VDCESERWQQKKPSAVSSDGNAQFFTLARYFTEFQAMPKVDLFWLYFALAAWSI
jgi:hypothetical protein